MDTNCLFILLALPLEFCFVKTVNCTSTESTIKCTNSKPYYSNCNLYYDCMKNGEYKLKKCPAQLHYNQTTFKCEDQESAGCIENTESCKKNMTKPHETECYLYYACEKNKFVVTVCPEGLHYSASNDGTCLVPSEAQCTLSTTSSTTTTIHGDTCTDLGIRSQPYDMNCTLYYLCIDGEFVLTACQEGLHYDYSSISYNVYCVEPASANCPYSTSSSTTSEVSPDTSTMTSTIISDTCADLGIVSLPHESSCEHYYLCMEYDLVLLKCQNGLEYSDIVKRCVYPEEYDCPYHTSPTTTSSTTTSTTTIIYGDSCTDLGVIGIPHEYNCSLYYSCVNHVFIPATCPEGLYFNAELHKCTLPHLSNCPNAVSTTTSPYEGNCTEIGVTHASSCTLYYKCVDNAFVLTECPDGKHFNPRSQICEEAAVAGCHYSTSTTSMTPHFDSCTEVGIRARPHEYLCAWYYACVERRSVLTQCAPGLEFNSTSYLCEDPALAKCPYSTTTSSTVSTTTDFVIIYDTCTDLGINTESHPTDCNLYYKCIEGNFVLQYCPEGLHFSWERERCEEPKTAGCQSIC